MVANPDTPTMIRWTIVGALEINPGKVTHPTIIPALGGLTSEFNIGSGLRPWV
jgi:hypothetical protein